MERQTDLNCGLHVRGSSRIGRLDGLKVLVAEDEVLIAMEMQAILEDDGAQVAGPFYTLSSALAYAQDGEISVAILDFQLGRQWVSPVARILTERSIPFLFYSGQGSTDRLFGEWPQTRLVSKPACANVLIDAVANLVRRF